MINMVELWMILIGDKKGCQRTHVSFDFWNPYKLKFIKGFNALLISGLEPLWELDVNVVEILNSIRVFYVHVVFFKLKPNIVDFTTLFISNRDMFATIIVEPTLIYVDKNKRYKLECTMWDFFL